MTKEGKLQTTKMRKFPEEVRFRSTWRPYQARVLSDLEEHLDDNKLHVVAAPGSGKTVLGLEVVCRINKPTLVLAPTLAIRDQWIQRLVELFLPKNAGTPDWVSRDLLKPGFITVATYQALHSVMSPKIEDEFGTPEDIEDLRETEEKERIEEDLEEEDDAKSDVHSWLNVIKKPRNRNAPRPDLVEILIEKGVNTIVLDEAHHLRSSWWKSLTSLIKGLGQPMTLALTATPPFDVPPAEWDRYMELCGPVDARIPVPELVMEKNLCPHQDLVIFSTPSEAERTEITKFRTEVTDFVRNLQTKHQFRDFVRSHEWLNPPEKHIEEILDQPDFFSSMLVYLYNLGVEIPDSALKIVADSKSGIPAFNLEWLEILLSGILYPANVDKPKLEPFLEEIRDELKRIGALERRKVMLRTGSSVDKILKQSISKLQRIVEIATKESESLGPDLRMVVLTDYIRQAFMPQSQEDNPILNKIGVAPIFEAIRRANFVSKIGILSGSLVVIPLESEKIFRECAMSLGITKDEMSMKKLVHDSRFLEVRISDAERHKLVRTVTDLFTAGGINILIGTKSLLGEGWDAPSINSLVLASFVGSYMLSNQMRGRAIRSERGNPDKTANIWHIVCVEPDSELPGEDFLTMQRRFKAFVGVSALEPVIENGFSRLGIGKPPFSKGDLKAFNENMFLLAKSRNAIRKSWEGALRRGEDGVRLVEEIQAQKVYLPRGFVFRNTISALFWQGLFLTGYFLQSTLDSITPSSWQAFLITLAVLFIICMLIMAPTTFKAIYLFIKHGPVKGSLKQIGVTILKTLCHMGEFSTDYTHLRVVVEEGEYGEVFCHLEGGSNREKSVYLQALSEILNPIENPRYLLIRKSLWWNRFTRKDYHAVPSVIGAKKEYAQFFADTWAKNVGRMNLVYTRNREGRIELLHARNKSLSATFRPRSERLTRWK